MQQYAGIYLLQSHSTCFGCPSHPSSGVHKTVTAASGRVQLKCDGTRRRAGGELKGKLANGVGSQYSSHYLGTWCIQHYYY
jgi:hypothetical protein